MNDKPIYHTFEEKKFVGRVTKDPYLGNGMASVALAINHSYKGEDGQWKQVDPVYENILVFDDENFRFIQDHVYKGIALEVFGRVQYKASKGYVNRNIVINDRSPDHYIKLATPVDRKVGNSTNTKPTPRTRQPAPELDDEIPF